MNAPVETDGFFVEIEAEVLGALMTGCDTRKVLAILSEHHFIEDAHKLIFRAIKTGYERYNSANPATVLKLIDPDFVKQFEVKAHMKMSAYLASVCANTVYGAGMVERNAWHVLEQWARYQVAIEADKIAAAANDPASDVREIVATAGRQFDDIMSEVRRGPSRKTRLSLAAAAELSMKATREAMTRKGLTGITWGLSDVNRLTGGIHKRDLTLVAARPSMGKAQPLFAKIRTPNGWRNMGSLRIGDEISSVDGADSRVTGIFPQPDQPIYRVTFSDGRSTRCTAEHLWRAHYRGWKKPRILSTIDLIEKLSKERYQRRLWVDQVSPSGKHDHKLPLDPWVLGALLGDGGFSGGAVRFSSACEETVQRMASRLPSECVINRVGSTPYEHSITMRERKRTCQGWPAPNVVIKALKQTGLYGLTSEFKFIPRQYLDSGPEQRLDLLRGLLDTDGWVERHGSVCFCTVSIQLAEGVCEIARSLGAWCSINPRVKKFTHRGQKRTGLPSYVCVISHPEPKSLFLMSSKVARAPMSRVRRKLPVITGIDRDGFEPAQCISVSHPSSLYVTDDYIVTHNTTVGLSCAIKAAKIGAGVGFVSLEMDSEKLAARAISDIAYDWSVQVPYADLIKGYVDTSQLEAIESATRDLARLPLWIEDQSGLSMTDIRVKVEALADEALAAGHTLDVVIIDHLGLIKPSSRYSGNRTNEIGEISAGLKAMARELDIAVVALSQLNRAVESRPLKDRRPQLSDLRDSGAIEQDADTIIFLFREAYYLEREKGGSHEQEVDRVERLADCQNLIEFNIAKQRNGPLGTIELFASMAHSAVRNGARG